ncbi:cyclophilin-like protein [Kockiozyma suomiensis]|uniref:cyclophilin-like protein n=1 Tax=Kockiozyma suomiensis TaxID=1337062 RepID=UPI00334404E9
MSSALEPPTTAKVIFQTSKGPLEIELWAKETPKACRNFLQLCLDGVYNNTIFHRVVKDFLIQGGDPTGTGHGGSSIYHDEGGFETEIHSRLRFNRRGLLGNADAEKLNDNSQFFITLAATPELQGKHTLFGRIIGDTIFNVLKIGEAELGNYDRPLYPARITKTEIVVNYFTDMTPRVAQSQSSKPSEKKKKKAKPKVKMSFADDGDEIEETATPQTYKMRPAHEILNDSRLSNQTVSETVDSEIKSSLKTTDTSTKLETATPKEKKSKKSDKPLQEKKIDQERTKLIEKIDDGTQASSDSFDQVSTQKSDFDRINAEIMSMKASLKRKGDADDDTKLRKKTSLVNEERQKYLSKKDTSLLSKKKQAEAREAATLAMLSKFTSKLRSASSSSPAPALPRKSSKRKVGKAAEDEEQLCDLHNLANCQSCLYYDKLSDGEDDDPASLMTHTFADTKTVRVASQHREESSPPPPARRQEQGRSSASLRRR